MLGLYAFALIFGAVGLFLLKDFACNSLDRNTPRGRRHDRPAFRRPWFSSACCRRSALWALASRWMKISLLYGALGITYWLALLGFGKSPAELLHAMPVIAGGALQSCFCTWLIAMRPHKIGAPGQS